MRWSVFHSRVIRNKNLACDDSEGVRDRPREGLSLPYSPCPSSGSTEVGLNIARSVTALYEKKIPPGAMRWSVRG